MQEFALSSLLKTGLTPNNNNQLTRYEYNDNPKPLDRRKILLAPCHTPSPEHYLTPSSSPPFFFFVLDDRH